MLKVIIFGDLMGKPSRKALRMILPDIKKEYQPNLIVANVENLTHGSGVSPEALKEISECGVNFFTSGNHVWNRKKDIYNIFQENKIDILRPANYPPGVSGVGYKVISIDQYTILMINLIGRVGMYQSFDCPFRALDAILTEHKGMKFNAILVDFHAEATSEKVALGHYASGRVTAVYGTHTHVPTADAHIFSNGTAYVTDIGMVGLKDSVIGVDKVNIIKTFLTQIKEEHIIPDNGLVTVNAIYLTVDPATGKALDIQRIQKEVLVS